MCACKQTVIELYGLDRTEYGGTSVGSPERIAAVAEKVMAIASRAMTWWWWFQP